jgi:hypothetical protein
LWRRDSSISTTFPNPPKVLTAANSSRAKQCRHISYHLDTLFLFASARKPHCSWEKWSQKQRKIRSNLFTGSRLCSKIVFE